MSQKELILDGISITVMRKAVKNINLRVGRAGKVQVSAPLSTPDALIHRFAQSKLDWIKKACYRSKLHQQRNNPSLKACDTIKLFDRSLTLKIHESSFHSTVEVDEQTAHVYLPANYDEPCMQAVLNHWYKKEMARLLPALLAKWVEKIQSPYPEWSIRLMRSRWGSCNPLKKRITLNLQLVHYPLACLEQVIVHELIHFFESGHNQRFYHMMDHYMPNWQTYKNILDNKA